MKLIAKFEHVVDADEAAMLLSSVGIVAHVSSRGTKSLGLIVHSLAGAGLWAVLDHQHEDACELLNDPNHVVTTGLSEEELQEFKRSAGAKVFSSLNNAIMYGVVLIIVMLFLMNHFGVLK